MPMNSAKPNKARGTISNGRSSFWEANIFQATIPAKIRKTTSKVMFQNPAAPMNTAATMPAATPTLSQLNPGIIVSGSRPLTLRTSSFSVSRV